MKLRTDAGNIHSLKIFIAAELSQTKLEVIEVKPEAKIVPYLTKSRLPVLEISKEAIFFSVNSAARYILSKSTKTSANPSIERQIDEWLEWEAVELQPHLSPYLCISSTPVKENPDQRVLLGLHACLDYVNSRLREKTTLVNGHLTSADVVVWAALFPLKDKGILKDWESQYSNLQSWFSHLLNQASFQASVGKLAAGERNAVCQDSSTEQILSEEEIAVAVQAWQDGKSQFPAISTRTHPILPKNGERNILITSALPYVNNVPHLGNIIGSTLSADVFSRYCRLQNYNSLYICGTDEYGTATETKAMEEGLTPKQICDKYNKIHQEIYEWFQISFDFFGRTTTKQQTDIAQDIFWKLYNKGYVLQKTVDQLKCQKCDRFLADRFVEGTCPSCAYADARGDQCDKCGKLINAVELILPRCKICQSMPVIKSSEHLFLDLPQIEPQLQKHLDNVMPNSSWTNNAKIITNSWLRDGLKPRCISRDLKWGTPVPLEGYMDKVFYVWFDAPIGYLSITANYTEHWESWWKNPKEVELFNFLGKDNVPFHSVIFPCTLLGTNDTYTIVNHLVATEYLNYEDGKFSKSRGTGVFGNNAKETGIPADIFRFYLLCMRPESQDSSFCWDEFLLKNNSELLNNLGNFINRGLTFVANNFEYTIQQMVLHDDDKQLITLVNRELHSYIDNMEHAKMRDSIRNILTISRLGNQFMQSAQPWVLVKGNNAEKSRAGTVVSLASNVSCLLSILLQPFMPTTSKVIQSQLNAPNGCNKIFKNFVCYLTPGHKIGKPSPLFQKLEPEIIAELKKKYKSKQNDDSSHTNLIVNQSPVSNGPSAQSTETTVFSPKEVNQLTEEVANQGNKVRELKVSKAEKSCIDIEVMKLLELKKKLAIAQGLDPEAATTDGRKKKKGKKK